MLDKREFLGRYNIKPKAFKETGLEWADLVTIHDEFEATRPSLLPTLEAIAKQMAAVPGVHTVRSRVKDPEHLIEKIIRKTIEKPKLGITVKNYAARITDLVGIRALHLFKGDWGRIHDFVKATWDLGEPPTANVRKGDPEAVLKTFRDHGCRIFEHPFGYRSVHYLLKSELSRKTVVLELQVRTIFEEGWSEIDHRVRYPYDVDDHLLSEFLVIFNRLAGSADEMGSFITFMQGTLRDAELKHQGEYQQLLADLGSKISELEITRAQKRDLESRVQGLQAASRVVLGAGIAMTPMPVGGKITIGPTNGRIDFNYPALVPWLLPAPISSSVAFISPPGVVAKAANLATNRVEIGK